MKRILALAIVLAACAPSARAADALDLDQVLQRAQIAHDAIQDLSAQLTMVRQIPELEVKETSVGTLDFKKPRKLLITFTKPQLQYNLIVGREVTVYTPDKKQAEKYTLKGKGSGKVRAIGIGFMDSVGDARKDFDVKLLGKDKVDGAPAYKIELTPKPDRDTGPYDRIIIWFDTQRWLPTRLKLIESGGEVFTTITVSKLKLNKGIRDSKFQLKWPRDVDVIRPFD